MGSLLMLLLSNLPTIISAGSTVSQIIKAGTPVIEAWQQVSPEVVPLIKNLATTIFGAAGDFEHSIVGALLAQHPLTAEQQARWDNHMTDVGSGGGG